MEGAAVEQAWFLLGWGRCWRWKGLQPLKPECLWAWVSFPVALSSLIFLYHDFILWDPANTVFFSSANSVFKAQFHCICSEALKTRILFGRTNLDITTRCRRQEPWVTSGTHHNHTASSPCPALKSYHNGYNIWLQVFYLTLKYKCPGEE